MRDSTPEAAYADRDLELFADLDRVAESVGLRPCLIGAGAIRLRASQWEVRLGRETRDWDFAVQVDSWDQYRALARGLVAEGGGFERAGEPHRFIHDRGGILDVVPYGDLEDPAGEIRWPDGSIMATVGLDVLEAHHEIHEFARTRIRTASRPALVGLKLLAYRNRRPAITRDIADTDAILKGAEVEVPSERIESEALDQLYSGEVTFGEVGAFLLGRDVSQSFPPDALVSISELLDELDDPASILRRDLERLPSVHDRAAERIGALRLGLADR